MSLSSSLTTFLLLTLTTLVASQSATATSSSPTASETVCESCEYYPPGRSYDEGADPMTDGNSDRSGGGAGNSDAFMGVGVGAQIGIIAAVVVAAIGLFIGTIIYYFRRRKQWEREVRRRSALPLDAKIVVGRGGVVKLADPGKELESGRGGVVEGERKPGIFNMLLGKF